jgi:hypothetical protein
MYDLTFFLKFVKVTATYYYCQLINVICTGHFMISYKLDAELNEYE